ncbi:MAG TPA: 16S rRNA (uracil(1498)-N(3))-methyltransferase [Rhodospirillaceae bacterium]|nr:16S rRNA (uracil(1498)-N(3))-methyltransferase [Candidatus Neomarinimicrobiota bacterium]HCX14932.1 16S rRNA (uracil(1498)-N(3))-methyltransferase [Rhodospirillaceae bacterium]
MSKTKARIRLFVNDSLAEGSCLTASNAQAHYLLHVMRCKPGQRVALFNGREGEWWAKVIFQTKRDVQYHVEKQSQVQDSTPALWLAFAPVKRMDFIAEKASELGVTALLPVITQRTDIKRINTGRLQLHAIEAAEQCSRLSVPQVRSPESFDKFIASWPKGYRLYFLDESGGGLPIAKALMAARQEPCGFMTGPEGGFVQSELDVLRQLPFSRAIGLGPRLLRAETAAIAALACWQALLGDWVSEVGRVSR